MFIKVLLSEKGQTQLLGAIVMGIIILTAGMYAIERNLNAVKFQIKSGHRTEMRTVLDGVTQIVANLYHNEANCDPVLLNEMISKIDTSGNLTDTLGNRIIKYTSSEKDYSVSVGSIQRMTWKKNVTSDYNPTGEDPSLPLTVGTSQDALVELWTDYQNQRVVQSAVLLNYCTYPCSSAFINAHGNVDQTHGICQVPSDQAIAFHTLSGSFIQTLDTCDARAPGDLNDLNFQNGTSDCSSGNTPDDIINVIDLMIFKNYLRSGSFDGSCQTILEGCTDLNQDGIINNIDLNILEKTMRGYLYLLPL